MLKHHPETPRSIVLRLEKANVEIQAAQRILFASLGPNMNTFFVGNHPVGHYIARFSSPRTSPSSPQRYIPDSLSPSPSESSTSTTNLKNASETNPLREDFAATQTEIDGEKTFFMKARIMAGQADLSLSQSTSLTSETDETDAKNTANLPAGVEKGSPPDGKVMVVDLGLEEIEDFQWLSRDEVEGVVAPEYWKGVKNMLVAQ